MRVSVVTVDNQANPMKQENHPAELVDLDEVEIGRMLCERREERGLTTTALAKLVGISQAQISRLENGRQGFRSSTLRKIVEALGMKPQIAFVL